MRTRRVRKNSSARLDNGDQRGSTATPLRTLLCQTGAPYPNCPVPSPSVCDLLWRSVWAVWGSCWSRTCCAKQIEWCMRSMVARTLKECTHHAHAHVGAATVANAIGTSMCAASSAFAAPALVPYRRLVSARPGGRIAEQVGEQRRRQAASAQPGLPT